MIWSHIMNIDSQFYLCEHKIVAGSNDGAMQAIHAVRSDLLEIIQQRVRRAEESDDASLFISFVKLYKPLKATVNFLPCLRLITLASHSPFPTKNAGMCKQAKG